MGFALLFLPYTDLFVVHICRLEQWGQGMQYFVSLLPGTYATVLFRQGFLNSVLNRMRETLPQGMINGIASGFDVKMSFFGHDVSTLALILVISISTIVLLGVFLFINKFKKKN